eukprot:TRINITY_DN2912_c0_g1_i4.p1 TRINITY_DN2912_c0_g1~~TRINITY_DN2912_c0_g1_i4.p1  ORF type:complete len:299 (-),score=10.72 TRINITY_DN2912_c0_g1_i4:94-990(-)
MPPRLWLHSTTALAVFLAHFTSSASGYSMRLVTEDDNTNDCKACFPGFYGNNNTCGDCPDGSCPDANCTGCPPGTMNPDHGQPSCSACPKNHVSYGNATNCTLCPSGREFESAQSCVNCSSGFFSAVAGDACQACPLGQFSVSGATSCTDCPPASYAASPGTAVCTSCGVGYFGQLQGQFAQFNACAICPGGFYCPEQQTTAPKPCPADCYCKEGSADWIACPLFFGASTQSTDCAPSLLFYLLTVAGGVVLIVVLIAVIYRFRKANAKPRLQPPMSPRPESDRLIPRPRDGPVYNGL